MARPVKVARNISRLNARRAAAIIRRRPRAAGVALRVVVEAERQPHLSLSECCALMDQETGWRHIFGHDRGGPYPGMRVTKARVLALVRHVQNGGVSNGVSYPQLTWIGYIQEANRDGGAWVPRVAIATGLNILDGHKRRHGWNGACQVFNSGSPHGAPGYATSMEHLKDDWHAYFARRGLA